MKVYLAHRLNQQAVLDLTTPFIRSKDGYDFVPEGTLFKEVSDFD